MKEVAEILALETLFSQIYVAPAFILVWILCLQCLSLDGTSNLAAAIPLYAWALSYLTVSIVAMLIVDFTFCSKKSKEQSK